MTKKQPHIVKFMSLDGTVFHMRCRTPFDPILDRSLWGFLILCNTAFTAKNLLMSELLSPREEPIHWAVQMFAFALISVNVLALLAVILTVFGFALFRLVNWGLLKAIYVPFFYIFPTAIYGLFAWVRENYVVDQNGVTIIVMFLIICACFDILYGRFAAKYHSKYIDIEAIQAFSNGPEDEADLSGQMVEKLTSANVMPYQASRLPYPDSMSAEMATNADLSSNRKEAQQTSESSAEPARITIGKQSFVRDEIRWIQSEDHYLNVHLASESVLLLGKLSDAVAQLSEQQGVQINRSMWVAHTAIQSIDSQNSRKMFVTLTDGQTLKVTPMGRKLLEKSNRAALVR